MRDIKKYTNECPGTSTVITTLVLGAQVEKKKQQTRNNDIVHFLTKGGKLWSPSASCNATRGHHNRLDFRGVPPLIRALNMQWRNSA